MSKSNSQKTNTNKLKEEFYKGMSELRESIRELRERQEKTDEQQKKTDEQMRETDKRVSRVSDGYSRFVEGIISPSAVNFFSDSGYKVEDLLHRIKIFKDKTALAEYDTIIEAGLNGEKYLLIGEAKTHCTSQDIEDFIERIEKMKEIEKYKKPTKIGFIASVGYGTGVEKYAIREGLYVFKVTDDIMEVHVPKGFIPKKF